MKFIISSYKTNGESIGIFEVENNNYTKLSSADIAAPSFIVSANNYAYTYEKNNGMSLIAYRIENGNLVFSDKLAFPGVSATHLVYSEKNNTILGCSYADGAFFSAGVENGKFTKLYTYQKQIEDDRLSRCHCVFLNNEETILGVVNIALDAIYFYDIKGKEIVYKEEIQLPKGVGPRHAIYNQDNSLIYVMTEYSNEVIVINTNTKEIIQSISTVPNFQGETFGATLLFSKDNKFLYASNRGEDSIAKFEVLANGKLEYVNSFSSGGQHPRHMILSSDGKYILSCNKDGNNVAIIDLEKEKVVLSIPFENVSGVDNL